MTKVVNPGQGFRASGGLDQRCSSCHGGTSPVASLVLGGVTGASSDIIQGLVNVDASNHEFKLVVPGRGDAVRMVGTPDGLLLHGAETSTSSRSDGS